MPNLGLRNAATLAATLQFEMLLFSPWSIDCLVASEQLGLARTANLAATLQAWPPLCLRLEIVLFFVCRQQPWVLTGQDLAPEPPSVL